MTDKSATPRTDYVKRYIDSVEGAAHLSAVEIIREVTEELAACREELAYLELSTRPDGQWADQAINSFVKVMLSGKSRLAWRLPDPVEKAWGQGRASAYRRCAESARSRPEDRDARIVELEKLVDRAYKMMQMAGYRITSQDTEHNNPLVSWMSDVRALKPSPSALNPKAAWPFPDATMSQQEKKDG
jgi:hypothetical protein